MCGILGWIRADHEVDKEVFREMLLTLKHRGPDDRGEYFSDNGKSALGHTRLSFLDLSDKGHQPFIDPSEKYILSFNGEIYNYLELKNELKHQYTFKTSSDTEVVLAAYLYWGIDFVKYLKGMFAIAVLDVQANKLYLIRDRFGIKPLYFHISKKELLFASELKAIMKSKVIPKQMDKKAFINYFIYRYVPSPNTIWEGVNKLAPAHYAEIDLSNLSMTQVEYWTLAAARRKEPFAETVKQVNDLISNSVREHIRSDVPVGSFLSGGYDSSALVLYMKKHLESPQTFSIGFDQWEKSEHFYAEEVAEHLEVNNKSLIADEKSLETLDLMPQVYDEPIADISIIPTFLVSQLARKDVKAVLSGEGADEIFGGYQWQHEYLEKCYPEKLLDKIKVLLNPPKLIEFYAEWMSMGTFDLLELKRMLHPSMHSFIPEDPLWFYRKNMKPHLSPMKTMQLLDIKCFMGELVLTKIDRASMANSLEVRVPFLDHELFEKVFSLDERQYLDKNQTKSLLYHNIKSDLPKKILNRQKQGFVGPDDYYMNIEWYRKELKDSALVEDEIINPAYLDGLLAKTYDWRLWKIVVMEKWYRHWLKKTA